MNQDECSQYVVSDPKALSTLKEDFELLCVSHQFKLTCCSRSRIVLVYDQRVEIEFRQQETDWIMNTCWKEEPKVDAALLACLEDKFSAWKGRVCQPKQFSSLLYTVAWTMGRLDAFV